MNKKISAILFAFFALLSFAALLYHTAGAVQPFDETPVWRHTIFIGICTICIYGLLKRPKWFVWFMALLTLQQLYSHGSYLITHLQKEHAIHLISVAVIILLPLVLILLIADQKRK